MLRYWKSTIFIVVLLLGGMFLARAEGLEIVEIDSLPGEVGTDIALAEIDALEAEITLDDGMSDVLPSGMEDALEINADIGLPSERVEFVSSDSLPDRDALFAGYVEQLFMPGSRVRSNGYAGDHLEGVSKEIYDALLPMIKEVAAGKRSDTLFEIPVSLDESSIFGVESEDMLMAVLAIYADYPYDLYWMDAMGFASSVEDDPNSALVTIYMKVREEYRLDDEYTTDVEKLKKPQIAAQKAKAVVRKYKKLTDFKKLEAYLHWICEAADYNDTASDNNLSDNDGAWQLVWVFDGDPKTRVEWIGYAEAFKYLCDMSTFKNDVRCCFISGALNGNNTFWNVVHMEDGKNYHVDVGACDTAGAGAPVNEWMFLQGYDSEVDFRTYCISDRYYQYSGYTYNSYPKEDLALSGDDYVADVAFTQGKRATLYMGNKLTLEAKLTPGKAGGKLTWKSSKPAVAKVSSKGVVVPKKAGVTTVTARTANGKTAKITVKVVDAEGVKLKEGRKKTLKVGKQLTLHATVSPSKVKTRLTWTSSNTKVAAVSKKGVVTAKKAGTARITVKTANGKSATINITVK